MMKKNISFYPAQSVYGTETRYEWFKKHLKPSDKVIDLGCGTGVMITLPLLQEGVDVIGLDLDRRSIDYGKKLLRSVQMDETRLACEDFFKVSFMPNKIIFSQVLEHLDDQQMDVLLKGMFDALPKNGMLLITVPNGYGWFELESFLWEKMKLGKLVSLLPVEGIKRRIFRIKNVDEHPSSLDSSPHLQRFTYFSLQKKLKSYGFKVEEIKGGSFFAGPFSHVFFTGFKNFMKFNMFLGRMLPMIASDFYLAVRK